jgi:hypothetical protein
LALGTYAIALSHFVAEAVVYKTTGWGVVPPFIVACQYSHPARLSFTSYVTSFIIRPSHPSFFHYLAAVSLGWMIKEYEHYLL